MSLVMNGLHSIPSLFYCPYSPRWLLEADLFLMKLTIANNDNPKLTGALETTPQKYFSLTFSLF